MQQDCTQRERRCYECNGIGHIRPDCPTLKKSSEKTGGKPYGKSGWKGHGRQKACKAAAEESDDECEFSLFAQHALSAVGTGGWIIDSGTTSHMCNDKTLFRKIDSTKTSSVTVGDGRGLRCAGVGEVVLCLEIPGGKTQRTAVRDVLYVPGLAFNLFSVPMANRKGCAVVFDNDKSEVMREGRVMATGSRSGSLYYLDCKSTPEAHVTTGEKESKENLWYQRYGHLSETSLKKLVDEGMVNGLDCNASKKLAEPVEVEELVEAKELAEVEGPVLAKDEVPVEARRLLEDSDDQRRAGRPMRQRNPPDRYGKALITDVRDPETHEEVMATDRAKWRDAMKTEMQSLKKNDVLKPVKLPKDRKIIRSKWVFKTKVTPEGEHQYKCSVCSKSLTKFKALKQHEKTHIGVV